jgi:hypothetical protein
MTQPPTRHEALERYLTLATWGLWGSNKHTLRLELESHVRHKARKYQVQGIGEAEAINKALEDLGQAQHICAGMNGVYTMPNMIRQTLLVGILMSLGVAGFNSSAQIATSTRFPIQPCLDKANTAFKVGNQPIDCESDTIWVRKTDLRKLLEPKGVKFSKDNQIEFPNATKARLADASGWSFGEAQKKFEYSSEYIDLTRLIGDLSNSQGVQTTIEGWKNPVITIGETQFSLGTENKPFPSEELYRVLLTPQSVQPYEKWKTLGRQSENFFYFPSKHFRHRLTVVDQPERVYVVLTIAPDHSGHNMVWSNVAPILERGTLAFTLDVPAIKLVNGYDDLKPAQPGQPTTAVLARINTNVSNPKKILEIVNPASVLIQTPERLIAIKTTPSSFCETRGGIDLSLQGKWSGNFTAINPQGQTQTGTISSSMGSDGLTTGKIINNILKQTAEMLGTTCANGSSFSSYTYLDPSNVLTSKGKVIKQSDGSLRGQSEEFENKKLIGKTEFVLHRK